MTRAERSVPREARHCRHVRGESVSSFGGGNVGGHFLAAAFLERFLQYGFDRVCGQTYQSRGEAKRDHVGPTAGKRLSHLLERQRRVTRASLDEHLGRLALLGIAQHHARGIERNLVGEAVDVLPVDADQNVETVVQAFDRRQGKAQQRRRFAAADLRPARAHHQAVPAGLRCNLEQQVAGGHHACAAAAGNRKRNACFVFCPIL